MGIGHWGEDVIDRSIERVLHYLSIDPFGGGEDLLEM